MYVYIYIYVYTHRYKYICFHKIVYVHIRTSHIHTNNAMTHIYTWYILYTCVIQDIQFYDAYVYMIYIIHMCCIWYILYICVIQNMIYMCYIEHDLQEMRATPSIYIMIYIIMCDTYINIIYNTQKNRWNVYIHDMYCTYVLYRKRRQYVCIIRTSHKHTNTRINTYVYMICIIHMCYTGNAGNTYIYIIILWYIYKHNI